MIERVNFVGEGLYKMAYNQYDNNIRGTESHYSKVWNDPEAKRFLFIKHLYRCRQ